MECVLCLWRSLVLTVNSHRVNLLMLPSSVPHNNSEGCCLGGGTPCAVGTVPSA